LLINGGFQLNVVIEQDLQGADVHGHGGAKQKQGEQDSEHLQLRACSEEAIL